VNPRILLHELVHQSGLVGRQIVQDDVILLLPGAQRGDFLEEGNELTAGVASGRFSLDPPGDRVKGSIQGPCSMAVVFESVALRTAERKRQHRILAILRLNGGLLIRSEYGRMSRWIQVQADYIGGLRFKVRVFAGQVRLQPMRLQFSRFPGAMPSVFAHIQDRCQLAMTPVCRSNHRLLARSRQIPGPQGGRQQAGRLARLMITQSIQAGIEEPCLPAANSRRRSPQLLLDGVERYTLSQHQNQPCMRTIQSAQQPCELVRAITNSLSNGLRRSSWKTNCFFGRLNVSTWKGTMSPSVF
jgi:hypothetical protein